MEKTRVWLGTFDSTENAVRAYEADTWTLLIPKAKTNFPSSSSFLHENHGDPLMDHRL